MISSLDSQKFHDSKHLPTILLIGEEETDGTLGFSDDEKWVFSWGESGHLQAWSLQSKKRVLNYNQKFIRGAVHSQALDGLVAVGGGSLLFFLLNDSSGENCQILVEKLPMLSDAFLIDTLDSDVSICVTPSEIVCASRNCIVSVSRTNLWCHRAVQLPNFASRRIYHMSCLRKGSVVLMRFVTSLRHEGVTEYIFSTVASSGETISEIVVQNPDIELLPAPPSHSRTCRYTTSSGYTNVVSQMASGEIGIGTLFGAELDDSLFASPTKFRLIAVSDRRIAFWERSNYTHSILIGEPISEIKMTFDPRFAFVMYSSRSAVSELTGLLDLTTGKPVGFCHGHTLGSVPFSLSSSGRFFATLVTDPASRFHPANLASGTVVLTDIQSVR